MTIVRAGWIVGIAIRLAFFTMAPRACAAAPPEEARPDEPPATIASPPHEVRRWYGWQTFAADGVAGAFFLSAVADHYNTVLFGFSGLTFGLGAPAIHVVHRHWGVAIGSLGMRILGPFVGAAIGAQGDVHIEDHAAGGGDSSGKWTAVGAGIGGLVVSAIDGALLAYDSQVSDSPPPRRQMLMEYSLPQVVVLRHGVAVGYSGQF